FPTSNILSADNQVSTLSSPSLHRSKKRTDPLDSYMDECYRELARRTVDQKFSTRYYEQNHL
ncbi:MAG TPA: hypothetical protein VHF08_03330, partial [Nitrososphaeraceae archaeon]|nr:hypothetical protein [Nitrososphaeraceae archaeon]